MAHIERKIDGEIKYDGKIIKLHLDTVELEDGSVTKREYVEHNGGATVIAETDEGILFVEQFRYPYGHTLLELPAGKRDGDEDPKETARRELEEETGYIAEELDFLGEVYPSPGYTNERLFLYRARGLTISKSHTDEGEFLSVKAIKAEQVAEMIALGQLKDAKTLVALLKYFCFIR